MKKLSPETKQEIINRHLINGETITSLAEEYGVGMSSISYWIVKARGGKRADGTPSADGRLKQTKQYTKTNTRPSTKPKVSLREALYNEVADEYRATETKLRSLHAKLKFLGEEWNEQDQNPTTVNH